MNCNKKPLVDLVEVSSVLILVVEDLVVMEEAVVVVLVEVDDSELIEFGALKVI